VLGPSTALLILNKTLPGPAIPLEIALGSFHCTRELARTLHCTGHLARTFHCTFNNKTLPGPPVRETVPLETVLGSFHCPRELARTLRGLLGPSTAVAKPCLDPQFQSKPCSDPSVNTSIALGSLLGPSTVSSDLPLHSKPCPDPQFHSKQCSDPSIALESLLGPSIALEILLEASTALKTLPGPSIPLERVLRSFIALESLFGPSAVSSDLPLHSKPCPDPQLHSKECSDPSIALDSSFGPSAVSSDLPLHSVRQNLAWTRNSTRNSARILPLPSGAGSDPPSTSL
jgi:hypothetical protein